MEHYIGPYTDLFIKSCANEINKKETREKICNSILCPLVDEIYDKYKTRIMMLKLIICLFIIIILINVVIGVMNYRCIKASQT